MLDRRSFSQALASTAFAGLALSGCSTTGARTWQSRARGYGELVSDPNGLFDLPRGFSYRVISKLGDRMDDGHTVPDHADGMGAIRLDRRRMALVRNHELARMHLEKGPESAAARNMAFDRVHGGRAMPGGTTTIILDYKSGQIERQHLSLAGTLRNCAGGTTPWGSWLTCEEDVTRAGEGGAGRSHGWVFEVPARSAGLVAPIALTAMGRFNHEAVAVDPRTGIIYLTEDRPDGLFYRFLPNQKHILSRGGRLQALAFRQREFGADSRNWSGVTFPLRSWREVEWIDLDNVDSPADDLRKRGHERRAMLFANSEGIHIGDRELYFCCTRGGAAKQSQIMRYQPSRFEGSPEEKAAPARLQLFVESTGPSMLSFGDNLTVAPTGHLIVCEDQYSKLVSNHLQGITPDGAVYKFARLHAQTELAGACFSPDGETLFVNVYSPAKTLAIRGPWRAFSA